MGNKQGGGEYNAFDAKKNKHQAKLDAFNLREASTIGDKVINLDRGMHDKYCIGILCVFVLVWIALGVVAGVTKHLAL